MTLPNGASVRDFLVIGVVGELLRLDPDLELTVLTGAPPAVDLAALVRTEDRPLVERVQFATYDPYPDLGFVTKKLAGRRQRRMGGRGAQPFWYRLERAAEPSPRAEIELLEALRPDLVVSGDPKAGYDYRVALACRALGLPLVGVVRSWDNLLKGLLSFPDRIAVWGPTNYREAVDVLGYDPGSVTATGSPSFDPYFDETVLGPMYQPSEHDKVGQWLAEGRELLTLATSGFPYHPVIDETYLLDDLLAIKDRRSDMADVGVVVRLHPLSRWLPFKRYLDRPDVAISAGDYLPGIGWFQTAADIQQSVQLLGTSRVVVTPASSWAIEAAIFDTPMVCPVYNTTHPALFDAQIRSVTLDRHFAPLLEQDLVDVVWNSGELADHLDLAWRDPGHRHEARERIVDQYVGPRDGRSRTRVAEWLVAAARSAAS